MHKAEANFLWRIPGDAFTKGIQMFSVPGIVLRHYDLFFVAWMIAGKFAMKSNACACAIIRVIVYLPGAPNPRSRSIMLKHADRTEPLHAAMMANH